MGSKKKTTELTYSRVTNIVGDAKFTIEEPLGVQSTYHLHIPIREENAKHIAKIIAIAMRRNLKKEKR